MTKLEQLINELCPNGVKYKSLNECVDIIRGTRVVKNNLSEDGKYPVYQNSLTPMGYHIESNASKDTTFIIVAGAAGEIGYSTVDFWAADDCFCLICHEEITSKFLYHLLLQQQSYIYSKVRKASIPRLSRTVVEKITIPVPPLPVQVEIVRILDNLTQLELELEAQLNAELEARRKQYEHYRDVLLSFDMNGGGTTNCEWRTLGETCIIKAGKAISATKISDIQNKEYPIACFGGNGLRGYVKNQSHTGEYPIIGRQGALCGNVNFAKGDFYATEHAVVVKSNGELLQRFLYHLLISMNLNQYKSQGAQPGLAVSNIEKILVPIPPIAEQTRIVSILDRFDALCNDITQGFPAEIEARRKQYEYYRDKLLTFEEKQN